MKKNLFVMAIAALTDSGAVLADGPLDGSVYGKINISAVSSDEKDSGGTDAWKLNSNASRLGVKGKTELSDGLYAIYKAEFEMFVDNGKSKNDKTFEQRNIIAGIAGSFGTLWAGRHDTPTKVAQNKIDLFNDLEGDIKNTFEGENRESNIVAYTSPTFSGVTVTVAGVFGEGSTDLNGDGDPTNDDGIGDGVSSSISWGNDNLFLAATYDKDVDSQDLLRLVGQWDIDNLQLGLMYQQNENNVDKTVLDEDGWFVSASYKISPVVLKAQYGKVKDDASDNEEETVSLGADYKLGDNTMLFVFYSDNKETAGGSGSSDVKDKYFGVGMEQKF